MNTATRLLALLLLVTGACTSRAAGLTLEDLLGSSPTVDSSLPRPEQVVGVQVGERHWYHHEIVAYLDALADASPRMVALGAHATSYGGRPLVSYAISS
ncbi:MAG: peptidase, partial [Cellvibrionales bacterium]